MSSEEQTLKPRRHRRWVKATLISLGVLSALIGVIVYQALQPKYEFLRGLQPTFKGNPFERVKVPPGAMVSLPAYYMELYSVQGDYDQWKKKIEPELAKFGAVGLAEVAIDKERRSKTWSLDKSGRAVAGMPDPQRGVGLADNFKVAEGQNPFGNLRLPKVSKGWITIAGFEPTPPTLLSRVVDWGKRISGLP